MSEAEKYFEAEAVRHALTLPVCEARQFLLGLLRSVDEEAFPDLRAAYQNFQLAGDQLELIAHPQGQLNLHGKDGAK